MPKKFSINELRHWLSSYEAGKPIASIAKQAHCDVRTVKKGIEQARLARDVSTARADLLKEALHRHQDDLKGVLEGILSSLEVPALNQGIPWKWQEASIIPLRNARGELEPDVVQPVVKVILDVEDKLQWGLLQEHLKRDKMWELVEQWKKAVAAHLRAKINLAWKTAILLTGKTHYPLLEKPTKPPFLYSYNVITPLYQEALYEAMGLPQKSKLQDSIVTDAGSGEVKLGGFALGKAPGAEDECKKNILKALKKLKKSEEAKDVATSYRLVEELTAKTRRVVAEISLLGLIPGQCRVCRRLGM